jgi:hypothetical protein
LADVKRGERATRVLLEKFELVRDATPPPVLPPLRTAKGDD